LYSIRPVFLKADLQSFGDYIRSLKPCNIAKKSVLDTVTDAKEARSKEIKEQPLIVNTKLRRKERKGRRF